MKACLIGMVLFTIVVLDDRLLRPYIFVIWRVISSFQTLLEMLAPCLVDFPKFFLFQPGKTCSIAAIIYKILPVPTRSPLANFLSSLSQNFMPVPSCIRSWKSGNDHLRGRLILNDFVTLFLDMEQGFQRKMEAWIKHYLVFHLDVCKFPYLRWMVKTVLYRLLMYYSPDTFQGQIKVVAGENEHLDCFWKSCCKSRFHLRGTCTAHHWMN